MSSPAIDRSDESTVEEKHLNANESSNSEEESDDHLEDLGVQNEIPPVGSSSSSQVSTKVKRTPTQIMVDKALADLKEKSGSSVYAIKKYILGNYNNLIESNLNMLIMRYLKKSIMKGKIVQNKRKFKLVVEKNAKKKLAAKKTTTSKKESADNAKSSGTSHVSNVKINVKNTALSKKPIKKRVHDKAKKIVGPRLSADPFKANMNAKAIEAFTASADSNQAKTKVKGKGKPHTKKVISDDEEEAVPSKKAKVKGKPQSKKVMSDDEEEAVPSKAKAKDKGKPETKKPINNDKENSVPAKKLSPIKDAPSKSVASKKPSTSKENTTKNKTERSKK